MTDVQVTCINKVQHQNPHEGTTHLGGADWRWTRTDVIISLRNGTNTFYIMLNGKRANVAIVE